MTLDGIAYDAKFVFEKVGYNLEGSEIGAGIWSHPIKKSCKNIQTRRKNFKSQSNFFSRYSQFFHVPLEHKNAVTGWLAFPILIDQMLLFLEKFQIFLEENNIQTTWFLLGT